jgi:hypothetical protein
MKTIFKVLGQSKRLTSVAAFGTAGVLLTATWAAGVVDTDATAGTPTPGAAISAAAPASNTDRFASAVTAGVDAGFPVDFSGRWGVIPDDDDGGADTTDYELFNIDLSNAAFDSGTYFVEVGILPDPVPSGFSALQVEWIIDDEACVDADWTPDVDYTGASGTVDVQTLYADTVDNSVVFPELTKALGPAYCVGVRSTGTSPADDPDGTFIRRAASGAWAGQMPTFVAIVNEHQ